MSNQRKAALGKKLATMLSALLLLALPWAAGAEGADPLEAFPVADMSGYERLEDKATRQFVDVTVRDVLEMMEKKQSFVLYVGFCRCPWCNALIGPLNQAALQAGRRIAYIDTRKDPAWTRNADLTDFDLFAQTFGSWLAKDETGATKLYVPQTFFIRDGEVLRHHGGVLEGAEQANTVPLTAEQRDTLIRLLVQGMEDIAPGP